MLSRQRMDLAADRRGLVGGDAESAVRVGVGRDGVRGGGDSIEGVIVEAGASAVGTCRTAKPPLRIVGVLLPCASRPRRPERLAVRRVGVGAGRTVCVCLRRDKAGGGVATPLRLVPVLAGTPGARVFMRLVITPCYREFGSNTQFHRGQSKHIGINQRNPDWIIDNRFVKLDCCCRTHTNSARPLPQSDRD